MGAGSVPPADRTQPSTQLRKEITAGGGGVSRTARQRSARIAPACPRVTVPVRVSCSRVGPVEALQHEAEAPLQDHHAEYLRRRGAGGEDGVGHVRLVPAEPPRAA